MANAWLEKNKVEKETQDGWVELTKGESTAFYHVYDACVAHVARGGRLLDNSTDIEYKRFNWQTLRRNGEWCGKNLDSSKVFRVRVVPR